MAVKRKTGKTETPVVEPIETQGVEVIGEATNGLSSAVEGEYTAPKCRNSVSNENSCSIVSPRVYPFLA